MADRIEVETLKEGREPRKLEIETYSDYFVTRKGSRRETGTIITLFLKDDVDVDLIEELKNYARHVEFPIYVDDGENTEIIVDRGYDFNFMDYLNPLYKQYADELNPYIIDFEKEGIEGVKGILVFMFLKDKNGSYGFKSKILPQEEQGDRILSMIYHEDENKRYLSQDGIVIKKIGRHDFPINSNYIIPSWIDMNSLFFDVNLEDKSKLDLTMDRNNFVINDKFNNLRTKIEDILINHIKNIFSQKYLVNGRDKNVFMEQFFEKYGVVSFYRSNLSDFSLEWMKKVIIFKCSISGDVRYLTYNELKDRWKYFYFFNLTSFRHILENIIEKAYPKSPIIYSTTHDQLPHLLLRFSEKEIIVTNKEFGFSIDKYLLLPSAEKRDKKEEEYGFTFEGDYKDCFGTLTTWQYDIAPNINHPFIRLVNRNTGIFKGKEKKEHEFFIEKLLGNADREYLKLLKEIQRIQQLLLDFYVKKGILTKEEAERYVLTEKDFCPYDMGEDFLK